jgi:hypothetical protein
MTIELKIHIWNGAENLEAVEDGNLMKYDLAVIMIFDNRMSGKSVKVAPIYATLFIRPLNVTMISRDF